MIKGKVFLFLMTVSAAFFAVGTANAFFAFFLLRNDVINSKAQYEQNYANHDNFFHTNTFFLFAFRIMAVMTAALRITKISPGRKPAANVWVVISVPI